MQICMGVLPKTGALTSVLRQYADDRDAAWCVVCQLPMISFEEFVASDGGSCEFHLEDCE